MGDEDEERSSEEEIRESEWSVNEVKKLFVQVSVPHWMEKTEEEWIMEGEERNATSLRISVPVDVTLQSGDVMETLSVTVKESRMSDWVDRDNLNGSFTISYVTEEVTRSLLRMDTL